MNSLFMPQEQENRDLLNIKNKRNIDTSSWPDKVLLGACENKIYIIPSPSHEPVVFKEREGNVHCFGSNGGIIHDGGEYGVVRTYDDRLMLSGEGRTVYALRTDYDGEFYWGDDTGVIGNVRTEEVVTKRPNAVLALENHRQKLYDAGMDNKIFRTLDNEIVHSRDGPVYALHSWDAKLFDGGVYGTIFTDTDLKWDRPTGCEITLSIFEYRGRMCYLDNKKGILDVFSADEIIPRKGFVNIMPVHKEIINEYLEVLL